MSMATLWPYALALVLLLALVIVVLLVLVLRKSAKASEFSDTAEDAEEPAAAEAKKPDDGTDYVLIGAAFQRARKIIRSLSDRDQYGTFHLLIGAEGSREPHFLSKLSSSGMQLAYEPVRDGLAFGDGCAFHFFDDGIVLDVAGEQVLGATGLKSDVRGWKTILRQLRELRPKRPVDGVILTISCSELVDAMKVESHLAARADCLHRALWDLQRELGFRLPVYVLVTGCETKLEGFRDFAAALPQTARGEMIGWSSPHDVRLPYNAVWLDDAFDDLHRDLRDAQMQLFAAGTPGREVMLFPSEVQALRKPLRTFLNHLFKPSAYREGMVLRGFYLCGSFEEETVFAADLIEQKIFPETGLAIPTSSTKMARNRKVRVLQGATAAAALLFTFGLIWAWFAFRHQNRILRPLLESALDARTHQSVASGDAEVKAATEILDGMAKIDFHRYGSVFVPSSWSGAFDRKLRASIATTFSTVVLDAVGVRLERKAAILVRDATTRVVEEGALRAAGAPADAILPVEETPEFRKLQKFVAQLQQVELHGRMFNALSEEGQGELRSLGELVKFSFGHPISERFFRNGELYEKSLRLAHASRTFDPQQHQAAAIDGARLLADELYARLYHRNPFAARLASLERALTSGGTTGRTGADEFRMLAQTMHDLEHDLAGPELQWAFRPGFDLGPSWSAVLAAMNNSQFFGPRAVEAIRQRGFAGWSDFGLRLDAETPYTGRILATRDGRPEMRLSTDTLVLKSAIESFVHQGFAGSAAGQESLVTTLQPDTRMKWNPRLLQQAVSVSLSYDRFREKGLKLFYVDLQHAVDAAAQEQASAQMQALIRDAQTIERAPMQLTNAVLEQELQNGIDAFAGSAKLVDQNIDILGRLDAHSVRGELVAAMTAEAMRLLRMTDDLLERSPPYKTASDFGWRDAAVPPSPAAWGAQDPAELALYLDATRARLARLSRGYAKPLVAWMAHAGTDDLPENAEIVNKWQSVLDDLDDYDAKKPGNATAALEDYISGPMAKVTMRDCAAAMLAARPSHAERYLGGKLDRLSRQVTELCWAEASHEATRRYAKIAEFFNDRLAGRYPFSPDNPASAEVEASAEDIRRFYRLFDESDAIIRSIPADTSYSNPLRAARPFLDDMRRVRLFFAAYLDPAKGKRTPEVDVETQFRTLQHRELAGNEIIRWSLTIGGETITDREKAKKLRWTPGDPVRLSLRWASDAPHVPVPAAARRGMTIADRTVTYEYTNQWALLSALSDLRAAAEDLGPGVDAPPVTLALMVQTEPAPGGTPLPRSAQVFMRLALLTPDGAPMEVPDFPTKAPAIEKVMIGDLR